MHTKRRALTRRHQSVCFGTRKRAQASIPRERTATQPAENFVPKPKIVSENTLTYAKARSLSPFWHLFQCYWNKFTKRYIYRLVGKYVFPNVDLMKNHNDESLFFMCCATWSDIKAFKNLNVDLKPTSAVRSHQINIILYLCNLKYNFV